MADNAWFSMSTVLIPFAVAKCRRYWHSGKIRFSSLTTSCKSSWRRNTKLSFLGAAPPHPHSNASEETPPRVPTCVLRTFTGPRAGEVAFFKSPSAKAKQLHRTNDDGFVGGVAHIEARVCQGYARPSTFLRRARDPGVAWIAVRRPASMVGSSWGL